MTNLKTGFVVINNHVALYSENIDFADHFECEMSEYVKSFGPINGMSIRIHIIEEEKSAILIAGQINHDEKELRILQSMLNFSDLHVDERILLALLGMPNDSVRTLEVNRQCVISQEIIPTSNCSLRARNNWNTGRLLSNLFSRRAVAAMLSSLAIAMILTASFSPADSTNDLGAFKYFNSKTDSLPKTLGNTNADFNTSLLPSVYEPNMMRTLGPNWFILDDSVEVSGDIMVVSSNHAHESGISQPLVYPVTSTYVGFIGKDNGVVWSVSDTTAHTIKADYALYFTSDNKEYVVGVNDDEKGKTVKLFLGRIDSGSNELIP